MKKEMLWFFITDEEMIDEKNHVNGLEGLSKCNSCTNFEFCHGIVIHVDQPISGTDIINSVNLFANRLERNGIIAGHGVVLPERCGKHKSKFSIVLTSDDKYRQGRFIMEIWR